MVFTYQGKTWSLLIKVKHGLFVGTKGAEKRLLQKKTERPNKKKNNLWKNKKKKKLKRQKRKKEKCQGREK